MAAQNQPIPQDILDDIAARTPSGITIPPPSVRGTVEKTAGYIHRHGRVFEQKLLDGEIGSKVQFLLPDESFHSYYLWRLAEIQSGKNNVIASGRENEPSFAGRENRKGPERPPDFTFSARMPKMSAQDLEVVKLTALFVAKNGKSWLTTLSQREAANYQFDFLRPTHTYFQFFSRLKDQYVELLSGEVVNGGQPQQKRIAELQDNIENRAHVLERARKRAEWVKHNEQQQVAKQEAAEEERQAYASIDWHDFIIVETVLFDERDAQVELPPPTSLNDLQSASLEQKAANSIDPSRRLEEGFNLDGYNQPAQRTPQPPPSYNMPSVQPPMNGQYQQYNSVQAEREQFRAAQEAARAAATQPMKIRTEPMPRAQVKKDNQNMHICPNCKQPIPADEIENHVRIEMLDPRWREQSKIAQQRSSTTNLSTADVANNLKRLASQRTDVFDPITGRTVPGAQSEAKRPG